MSADIIDLLDAQAERAARKLGNEAELRADGGQALYNALPRELQKAFVHLAFLMRDADHWPPADLVTSIARYHGADEDAALVLMGWLPRRELTEAEARCAELSQQIVLGLSYELETGEPADLTSAVPRR